MTKHCARILYHVWYKALMTSALARTQTDADLAATQARVAQDSARAELIAKTRRFKSSWIELAEALSACRQEKRYQSWGYASFEDYYRKELHLRAATVDKLVGSYAFLHKSAPDVLQRDGLNFQVPSYQAVDFLRRAQEAQEEGQADADAVAEVRQAVLEEGSPLPKLSRLFKKTLFPDATEVEKNKQMQEANKAARRLQELVGLLQAVLPMAVYSQAEVALRALIEALPVEKKEISRNKLSTEQ